MKEKNKLENLKEDNKSNYFRKLLNKTLVVIYLIALNRYFIISIKVYQIQEVFQVMIFDLRLHLKMQN